MKAEFKIERPQDVECSLTITMPLQSWARLRAALSAINESQSYPFYRLNEEIRQMIARAEKHFEFEADGPDPEGSEHG